MIRAVIFDRDETLLRFDNQAIARVQRAIGAIAPALPPDAALRHWIGWPGPWPSHAADEPAFWQAFWRTLAQRYDLRAAQAQALTQAIGPFYPRCFGGYPDVDSCLQTLATAGLRLAVLTNFPLPSIDRTLAAAGIDPAWFTILRSSATLGVRKPDPRAFRTVAAELDLPLEACALIDNTVEHIVSAQALGMRAFLIDRRRLTHDLPAGVLCSLRPLPALLGVGLEDGSAARSLGG
jgi:FMN phosphatase YigB (HAD superfamily)